MKPLAKLRSALFPVLFVVPVQWLVLGPVPGFSQGRGDARISIEFSPSEIRFGERLNFKIRVTHSLQSVVSAPRNPAFRDWDFVDAYESRKNSTRRFNGVVSSESTTEIVYVLSPRRSGNLFIPSISLEVDGVPYATVEEQISVRGVAGPPPLGAQPRDPEPDQIPFPNSDDAPVDVPERQTFFVNATISKPKAYVGELLVASYDLYRRPNILLTEHHYSKFPDFKGFLREELFQARSFEGQPVRTEAGVFVKAELLRFALFPLRAGKLQVQRLQLKMTAVPSMMDLLTNPFSSGPVGIPTEKASPTLTVDVKELPPPPNNVQFTGAVGSFSLKTELTQPIVKTKQPLTVRLIVEGRGNVKSIEAPNLVVPETLERFDRKSSYEFKPDATGFKVFEYLFLPLKAGPVVIPKFAWTYFNPDTESYVTLTTDELKFNVEQGPENPETVAEATPEKVLNWGGWYTKKVESVAKNRMHTPWTSRPEFWALHIALSTSIMGVLGFRRRAERLRRRALLRPWDLTEDLILSKKTWTNAELASLCDLYIRQRLSDAFSNSGEGQRLNFESTRDEFLSALDQKYQASNKDSSPASEALRAYWTDLDQLRFTGQAPTKSTGTEFIKRAKLLWATIEIS